MSRQTPIGTFGTAVMIAATFWTVVLGAALLVQLDLIDSIRKAWPVVRAGLEAVRSADAGARDPAIDIMPTEAAERLRPSLQDEATASAEVDDAVVSSGAPQPTAPDPIDGPEVQRLHRAEPGGRSAEPPDEGPTPRERFAPAHRRTAPGRGGRPGAADDGTLSSPPRTLTAPRVLRAPRAAT